MARPIEHVPDPERGELAGDTNPAVTQLQRVIVTLEWDDGTTTEHRAFTHHWTRTHVRVIVELDHDLPRRTHVLWVRADQVRRNTAPPEPGEPVPAPEVGPTAVRHHPPGSARPRSGHIMGTRAAETAVDTSKCR